MSLDVRLLPVFLCMSRDLSNQREVDEEKKEEKRGRAQDRKIQPLCADAELLDILDTFTWQAVGGNGGLTTTLLDLRRRYDSCKEEFKKPPKKKVPTLAVYDQIRNMSTHKLFFANTVAINQNSRINLQSIVSRSTAVDFKQLT